MTVPSSSSLRLHHRRFFSVWWLIPKRRFCVLLLFFGFAVMVVVLRGPLILPATNSISDSQGNDIDDVSLSYETRQQCVDDYTSRGAWEGSTWRVDNHPTICRFQAYSDSREIAAAFQHVKIGFVGDSTTRSDLRAWEETFRCNRTNLDEAQVFQKRNEQGSYICDASEQSINLTKCGIPPIIDVTDCPPGVSFRYIYKIYPWTPLDQWYLGQQPDLFRDLDVLVISLGRWFVYYDPQDFDIAGQLETFLAELKKVFKGTILYQSEYNGHLIKSVDIKYRVPCAPHASCVDCGPDQHECSLTDESERPQRDVIIRTVLEGHRILHLDRWNVSKTLPSEYFQPWYCNNGTFHQWYCSHYLGFVALQHMRLIANVVKNLFVFIQDGALLQ